MQKELSGYFHTSHLPLAAYLNLKYKVAEIDRTDKERLFFIFESTDELVADVNKYWDGEALVDPLAYFDTIKSLKSQIYAVKYEE